MRDAFGQALLNLAERFPKMVVLDADVATSTKTLGFGKAYPERFFNVGVAEANMADIAGGMAACGLRPVVSAFAIFIGLKCTDQIRNVACHNNLPVTFVGGYCGLSDSFDGASHQSITDIAIIRAMPNMTVVVPADAIELGQALEWALEHDGPVYIRISRNEAPVLFENEPPLEVGKIRKIRDGGDITIGACGAVLPMAIEAADILADEGISVELLEISTVKPMDTNTLVASVSKTGRILTVEEHNICGGLGSAVAECLARHCPVKMDFVGLLDTFSESGPYVELMTKYKISVKDIVEKAKMLTDE
jgi:transketolase